MQLGSFIEKRFSSLSGAEGEVEGQTKYIRRASPYGDNATMGLTNVCSSAQRGNDILLVSFFVVFSLITSCTPTAIPTTEIEIVDVYATPATQPWLPNVFACAPAGTAIRVANNPISADIALRLGEPDLLTTPAYQIDTEEILIVTHRQSPVQNMTVEEVRELFAGQGDPSVQVWVYAAGEDVQRVFEQAVMQGRGVTSLARLATSPQHMSDTLNNESNTVGILPRHWKVGDSRFVYTIPDVSVLVLVKEEPRGSIQEIIACLQK